MAKTRRKKINRRPSSIFGRHVRAAVVEQGALIRTSGVRKVVTETKGAGKDAKTIHVARVYTGVAKGKRYPYAGAKRGGRPIPLTAAQILDAEAAARATQ